MRRLFHEEKRSLQSRLKANDEAAIVLEFILRAENLGLRCVHLRHISFKALEQRLAYGALLSAGGQQLHDGVELELVIEQKVTTRQANARRA